MMQCCYHVGSYVACVAISLAYCASGVDLGKTGFAQYTSCFCLLAGACVCFLLSVVLVLLFATA